jgi:hypothetical protein
VAVDEDREAAQSGEADGKSAVGRQGRQRGDVQIKQQCRRAEQAEKDRAKLQLSRIDHAGMARGKGVKHGEEQGSERQRARRRVVVEDQLEESDQGKSFAGERRHQHEQRQRGGEKADAPVIAIMPRDESMHGDGPVALQRAGKESKDGPAQAIDEINPQPGTDGADDHRPEIPAGAEHEERRKDREAQGIGDGGVPDRLGRDVARRDQIILRAGAGFAAQQPHRDEKYPQP